MSFSHWLDRIQARIKNSSHRKTTRKRRSNASKRHNQLTPLTESLEDRVLLTVPEIAISGNGVDISDGDTTPDAADDTDFGQAQITGQTVTKTFTVTNSGTATLNLTGVSITGTGASHFTTTSFPAMTVAADGGTTTFQITFDPTAIGMHTATFNLVNDDGDETPFNFDLTGEGTAAATTLSIDDVTQVETDAGTTNFTFTVTRSSNVGAISVDYATANDTATTADSDYTGIGTTTLNFANGGALTQTVTVVVSGDQKVELDETFFVNLSNPVGATITDSQGLGTITNDDAATLSIDDITQNETDAGTTAFTFTVTLDTEVDTGVSFDFATANDATTADSDYTGISTTTRNFASTAAGATETITVQVNGDTTIESDETFFVNLSSIAAGGRGVTFADSQGLGTITNDDNGLDAMIDGGGNLVLDESGGNTIDILTISSDGTNLTISDATNPLGTGGIGGATGDGTTTITIPLSAFTGGIIINSLGNDDSLTVDFGGGANFDRTVSYNGGSTMQTGGDELFLQGGGTFALADYTFDNLNDGSIDVTGNQTISYTGLEPITSTITAADVTRN